MTRCAIYARYSSERQNERSSEDQIRICAEYATKQGWRVVQSYSDDAISGTAMANRPGINEALAAAEAGHFDVLLAEDEDRFARNLAHQAQMWDRMEDAGVKLWTISSGLVTDMHVALKGLMSQQYIRNLSAKTKRGMKSNAEKGLATGSRLYGYRSEPGGGMAIVEEEAQVIRRIFRSYAEGDTGRDIAGDLNREGIPGPRGGLWNASTILGSRQRGNGILNTELYVGMKVWGRNNVKKDRSTGKRQQGYLPQEQWQRTPVPHLRIIDDETWAEVRSRKDQATASPHLAVRRPTLFGGLLKCGMCGGSYTTYTSGKLVCAKHRESETCSNGRTPKRIDVEARVLEILQEQITSPEATAAYVRNYQQAAADRRAQAAAQRTPLEKRLVDLTGQIDRGVNAILRGTSSAALEARLPALEKEKSEIEARLIQEAQPEPVIELHPRTAEMYAALVAELQSALSTRADEPTAAERRLRDAVRALVHRIVLHPLTQARGGPIDITVELTLDRLLNEQPQNVGLGRLVAGGGIEPPTCGL